MMTKSLYELLKLIEASREFDKKSMETIGAERLNYFHLRDTTLTLIDDFSRVIFPYDDIIEKGLDYFYADMINFLSDENNPQLVFRPEELRDLVYDSQRLHTSVVSKEQKGKYFKIRINPLFKKIMGENAKDQLPQIKKVFSQSESFELADIGDNINCIEEKIENWEENLSQKLENKEIDSNMYEYCSMQLEYLENYYMSILKGEQKQFEVQNQENAYSASGFLEPISEGINPSITSNESEKERMIRDLEEKYGYSDMSEQEQIEFRQKLSEREREPIERAPLEHIEGRRIL